jgi:hypothetical protein
MASSKEVAKQTETGLALSPEELQALLDQQDQEFDGDTYQTPILKICQGLTTEVKQGEAEIGDFFNTLTGESLGKEVDFIIAYYRKGRTARDRETGKYYVAPFDVIPPWWGDLHIDNRTTIEDAGFVGASFSEFPEAEEQFKARVNNKEHAWGKGPLVSTSYNYIGLVLVEPLEDEDGETQYQPVQLSLQRSNKSAADKIGTIKRAQLRSRPFWEKVFHLTTVEKTFGTNTSAVVNVKLGRPTTETERTEAANLALAANLGRTATNDAGDPDAVEAPDAKGGMAV